MKQPRANHQPIILELTAEQSRQIERATGKLVTELQVEIIEVTATPEAQLTPNHNHSTEKGETS